MRLRCFARRERPAPRKSTETSRCNGDPMFRRLLIANRGEIAIRVGRTAREMGIRCIGVYSEADRAALHRAAMDETVLIGGPLPVDSYLNIDHVLRAAEEARVDAVHPGYGFLSENPAFATRCAEAGLVFVGPRPTRWPFRAIRSLRGSRWPGKEWRSPAAWINRSGPSTRGESSRRKSAIRGCSRGQPGAAGSG